MGCLKAPQIFLSGLLSTSCSVIKRALPATISGIPLADLAQHRSFSSRLLLWLRAASDWPGSPAPAPSIQQNRYLLLAKHAVRLYPQHPDSCIFPHLLTLSGLPVLETLPIPRATTVLAPVLMGSCSPRSTELCPSLHCQGHLLMPLDSSTEHNWFLRSRYSNSTG